MISGDVMYNAIKRSIRHTIAAYLQNTIDTNSFLSEFKAVLLNPRGEDSAHSMVVSSLGMGSKFIDMHDYVTDYNSRVALLQHGDTTGNSIEWVLEAYGTTERPIPGYYIISMVDSEHYTVSPLHEYSELITPDNSEFTLSHSPIFEPRLRLDDGYGLMFPEEHYTVDWSTGKVTILPKYERDYPPFRAIYLVPQPEIGPVKVKEYTLDTTTLPGLQLAFGGNLSGDDKQLIVVENRDEPTYHVQGGQGEISFSIDISAPARHVAEDAAEMVHKELWQQRTIGLDWSEAIHITSIASSEASLDEEGAAANQEWTAQLSISADIFWSVLIPNNWKLKNIFVAHSERTQLTDEEEASREENRFASVICIASDQSSPIVRCWPF